MRKERALKITSASAAAIYALCSASPMSFAHAAPEDTGYEDWFEDDQFGLKEEYDSTLDLVIDRLYWGLQDDTEEDADVSARCYSIIESAKLNMLNVFAYLSHLLTEFPKLGDDPDIEQIDKLLPWSDVLPQFCK